MFIGSAWFHTGSSVSRVLVLSVLISMLAGCAPASGQAPAPTVIPAGKTTAPAVVFPTSTRVPPTPTPTPIPPFEGLSSGLNNATQARIRAVSGIPHTRVDVYINDHLVSNGGHLQANIQDSVFSGWIYVQPGNYTLTLVPHGKPESQALFAPVTINAQAGHRYTVAAMGQITDKTAHGQIFDETALEGALGHKSTNDIYITIDNVQGLDGLDILHDGKLVTTARFGDAGLFACPTNNSELEHITVTRQPNLLLAGAEGYCHFNVSSAAMWYGTYPNTVISGDDSQFTHDANDTLQFLASFDSYNEHTEDGHPLTFKTLLALIDKAGLKDLFASQQPYFFLAPTDEAFATLPKDQLNVLLNDPEQLTSFLKSYFIPGYYPYGSLSGSNYGEADTTVTNLLGINITLAGDNIDDLNIVAGPSVAIGNGNRLQYIDGLLPLK